MLRMYTSSRFMRHASMIFVSSCPARPTNGSPSRSSSAPGASPRKHNSCIRIADAEHGLRARSGQLVAARAAGHLLLQDLQRRRRRNLHRAGFAGTQTAFPPPAAAILAPDRRPDSCRKRAAGEAASVRRPGRRLHSMTASCSDTSPSAAAARRPAAGFPAWPSPIVAFALDRLHSMSPGQAFQPDKLLVNHCSSDCKRLTCCAASLGQLSGPQRGVSRDFRVRFAIIPMARAAGLRPFADYSGSLRTTMMMSGTRVGSSATRLLV